MAPLTDRPLVLAAGAGLVALLLSGRAAAGPKPGPIQVTGCEFPDTVEADTDYRPTATLENVSDVPVGPLSFEWTLEDVATVAVPVDPIPAGAQRTVDGRVRFGEDALAGHDGETVPVHMRADTDTGNRVVDQRCSTASISVPDDPGNRPPTAAFRATHLDGQQFRFVTEATDPDGDIVSYEWTFSRPDDTVIGTATGQSTTFTFPEGGTFAVAHWVEDAAGQRDGEPGIVDVPEDDDGNGGSDGPTAAPSVHYDETTNRMRLNGSGSTGSIVDYHWEVSGGCANAPHVDATTYTGQTATHIPDCNGTYTVTLTVEDSSGATDASTTSVGVDMLVNESWRYDLDSPHPPLHVNVHRTQALSDRNGSAPVASAIRTLTGAFEDRGLNYRLRWGFDIKNPPENTAHCDGTYDWWKVRVSDGELYHTAKDSNVLLIDTRGGGCGGLMTAVMGARGMDDGSRPWEVTHGDGTPSDQDRHHRNRHGLLHEVCHNLGFGHSPHPGWGVNNQFQGWWEKTPAVGDNGLDNICGQFIEHREFEDSVPLNRLHTCTVEQADVEPIQSQDEVLARAQQLDLVHFGPDGQF